MKKVIQGSARLIGSAEKVKFVKQTVVTIGQSRLNMQTVPLDGGIF